MVRSCTDGASPTDDLDPTAMVEVPPFGPGPHPHEA